MSRALLVVVLLLLPASLPAQASSRGGRCMPEAVDTLRFGPGPIFRNCDVDAVARLRNAPRPSFLFPRELRCAIVELEFVVTASGSPIDSSARVLWTNSPEFGEQVIRSLRRWRFTPARRDGEAVAQLVRHRYALPDERVPVVVRGEPRAPRPSAPVCE